MKYQDIMIFLEKSFRLFWLLAITGKIIWPETVLSWLKTFMNYVGHNYNLHFIHQIDIKLIFYSILFIEICLFLFLNHKSKITILFNTIILLFFNIIVFYATLKHLPGDCGCFGQIIVFENGINKVIFNFIFLLASLIWLGFSYLRPYANLNSKLEQLD